MKRFLVVILSLYIFLFVCGSIFAVGERTVSLGGSSTWNNAETRNGIIETRGIRSNSVLLLSSTTGMSVSGYLSATGVLGNFSALTEPAYERWPGEASSLDMYISFDESSASTFRDSMGHYRVTNPANLERVDRSLARSGTGAVLFGSSDGPITITPQSRNALFAPGKRIGDFTIEFWLYPLSLENGERIFSWASSVSPNGNVNTQRIQCVASRNRLQWSFVNFFTSTGGNSYINLEFSGNTPVIPRKWSHHLIRFDAKTGMLEYLVDGIGESITYATTSRRESSTIFTPVIGTGGSFFLGESFKGLLDELKIHSVCAGRSTIQKYPSSGGRMETKAIDLGDISATIVKIDVTGGRTGSRGNSNFNEFRENGIFRFADETRLHFFIRTSDNPWQFNNRPWRTFTPGEELSGIQGRYAQIAVDFYPSSDGEATPYLEQINIIYLPGEPPLPPRNVTAVAVDGAVQLRWRHSPYSNTQGYLVYYSSVRGELFGTDAALGRSPIDVGMTTSIVIDGLKNGTLYYFRVAAYDQIEASGRYHVGEFSAEVTARPLLQ